MDWMHLELSGHTVIPNHPWLQSTEQSENSAGLQNQTKSVLFPPTEMYCEVMIPVGSHDLQGRNH